MATKHTDICLSKAQDEEPIFVLRAQDLFAPQLVRAWVELARPAGTPKAKLDEALALAAHMEGAKVPD
jgi:hypothetical protein